VFDIALLAGRLQLAVEWLESEGTPAAGRVTPDFPVGFFGASTGDHGLDCRLGAQQMLTC
jgi:hypothetical protein